MRYDSCLAIMAAARSNTPRIDYATHLISRKGPAGSEPEQMAKYGLGPVFCVKHHWTDIIEIFRSGLYRFDIGRWSSPTTIRRVNCFSPVYVYMEGGRPYLSGFDHTGAARPHWGDIASDDRMPFYNGLVVDRTGRPLEACPAVELADMRAALEARRTARRERDRGYSRMYRAEQRWIAYRQGDRDSVPMRDIIRLRNASHRVDFMRIFGNEAVQAALPIIEEGPVESRIIGGREHRYQVIVINVGEDDDPQPNPYLKMINPSTGETCLEAVSPGCVSVDDALQFRNGTTELPITLT